jgi:alkylhydroperoxidase/carboxymuconolactone decarboxylase family protein YurZ
MYSKDNLVKIKKMNDLAPEVMKAFWAFDKAAVAEGAIPVKYKELIAVAVAVTAQGRSERSGRQQSQHAADPVQRSWFDSSRPHHLRDIH